ncbi:MAG: SsrA-binding protein SmpB [Christensenellaceae bacterium]|nr:SsrA-binding protein SmpB [Christensenellaceae bacterium]
MAQSGVKIIAKNKKAYHDFFIDETYEAGISLAGTEVKSIRGGKVNLRDCFAQVKDGELFVYNMHISPYEQGNIFNRDPMRVRKLLMHKREIARLLGLVSRDGYSLIPTSIYLKKGLVKIELGLAKGKKNYDKRESAKERDAKRDIDKHLKRSQRTEA